MILLIAAAIAVTACASVGDGVDAPRSATALPDTPTTEASAAHSFPGGPSALDTRDAPEFPTPLIDPAAIISGGPPPDGIPPIDDPSFLQVGDNPDLLPANEPVVALDIDGDARAYPIRAMVWHEIVNDTVGGVPVAVTYCPLCNSAATYDRRIEGSVTTFGTSGMLYASALVMYDRATESLWTHFDGRAVVGLLAGKELAEYPSPLLSWGEFRSAHPMGKVLDWEASGFSRDYGRNPYTGYDDPEGTPFLFRGALDDRAGAMARVVGIDFAGSSAAYLLDAVRQGDGNATNIAMGGTELVILWAPGQASALDDEAIADGADVGSVGVFVAGADGEALTFAHTEAGFIDSDTGSVWSITGEAVSGALAGTQLTRVPHLDTFWFAWSTYQPGTTLVEG
jgi:hypothetical protein